MAKIPSTDQAERQYREESDARALADADAIRANPDRLKGAQAGAKRMAADEEKRAAEQSARAKGLKKLASGGKPKDTAAKKPASSKPATKKAAAKKGGKR